MQSSVNIAPMLLGTCESPIEAPLSLLSTVAPSAVVLCTAGWWRLVPVALFALDGGGAEPLKPGESSMHDWP